MQLLGDRSPGKGPLEGVERAATIAPGGDGTLADVLDQREHLVAGLLAHDVTEETPEQADVVAEGVVLGRWDSRAVIARVDWHEG